jgi:zinc-ribbon domain
MSAQKPQLRTILTEDAELQQIEDDAAESAPEASPSAVFCTNCGTANPANSHYCRSCGQSLEEQVVHPASLDNYAPPMKKGKRDSAAVEGSAQVQPAQSTAQVVAMVVMDIITLLVMGALVLWTVNAGQGLVAVFIVVVWFFIEAARHGWKLD